jgi:hypothetical protein
MQRLRRLIIIFAVLFALFILKPLPPSQPFKPYILMDGKDVFDLLTPLVLIPIYWLLFQIDRARAPTQRETIVFMVLAALWVEGQGMHLAGNSIARLSASLSGTDIERLIYFYDEVLSHYMWFSGVMGLSALLMYRQWKNPFSTTVSGLGLEIGGGILHGLTFALMVLEGQLVLLGLPFSLLVAVFGLIWGRGKLRQQPILTFFFVAYVVAAAFFLFWRLYWGSFIEPLDVLTQL